MLGARYVGLNNSKGIYILLLDADQILEKDTLERAVNKMSEYDMLILEELSYNPQTWVEKALALERKQTHELNDAMDPIKGGLSPRFYKRNLLEKSFSNIPNQIISKIIAYEDAIIYYEALNISKRVGILNKSLYHCEEKTIYGLFKHYYRFGKLSKKIDSYGTYNFIYKNKSKFKVKNIFIVLSGKSFTMILIAFLKSIAYRLGYIFG